MLAARKLVGLLLAAQGFLVVTRILDHEAPLALGAAALVAGLLLLAWPHVVRGAANETGGGTRWKDGWRGHPPRRTLLAAAGILLVAAVTAWNAARASSLSAPEIALVLYGAALVALAAAPAPMRQRADTAFAWSLPLVAAPLALWSLNGVLAATGGGAPLAWYVRALVVPPAAAVATVAGADVRVLDDTVALAVPGGTLFLTVGAVCAGLYAATVFLGIVAFHAWRERTPPGRLAALVVVGVVGLHVATVVRVAGLALAGRAWGADALMLVHTHAGWILFLGWTVLFWAFALRPLAGRRLSPPA